MSAAERCRESVRRAKGEQGAALLVAIMAILLVTALGTALLLSASVESKIVRNFVNATGALYAAEAAAARAVDDLRALPDWSAALSGTASSAFVDGPPGPRTLADGRTIDLGGIVNLANCRQIARCSDAAMDATTADRPWGANNPRWQPFASGPLEALVPFAAPGPRFYVFVMVGDDQSENDGNPSIDGSIRCEPEQTGTCNPGSGVVALRAEAFGAFGAHGAVELTVARPDAPGGEADYNTGVDQAGARILSWRELR